MPHTSPRWLRRCLLLSVAALGATIAPAVARADSRVDVDLTLNQAGRDLAVQLGLTELQLEERLTTGLKRALAVLDLADFLTSFANATSFSSRGVGVDYATDSDGVMLGAAANLAVSADVGDGSPAGGVAPNLALMAGVNGARWGHPRWTLSANLFHRRGDSGQLDGSISSAGVHLQRALIRPGDTAKGAVRWGGLDLTVGVEMARWSFGIGDELTSSYEVEGDNGTRAAIDATATGSFDLHTLTFTAPVELTTSLRLLYVASVYAGVGLDVSLGRSRLDASLGGELQARVGNAAARDVGSLTLEGVGRERPSVVGAHALLGVQAELWKVKVFTQASYGPPTTASVALGLRVDL
jgi:hypothetical protein